MIRKMSLVLVLYIEVFKDKMPQNLYSRILLGKKKTKGSKFDKILTTV